MAVVKLVSEPDPRSGSETIVKLKTWDYSETKDMYTLAIHINSNNNNSKKKAKFEVLQFLWTNGEDGLITWCGQSLKCQHPYSHICVLIFKPNKLVFSLGVWLPLKILSFPHPVDIVYSITIIQVQNPWTFYIHMPNWSVSCDLEIIHLQMHTIYLLTENKWYISCTSNYMHI